jgi:hypothetical protein
VHKYTKREFSISVEEREYINKLRKRTHIIFRNYEYCSYYFSKLDQQKHLDSGIDPNTVLEEVG